LLYDGRQGGMSGGEQRARGGTLMDGLLGTGEKDPQLRQKLVLGVGPM